MRYGVLLSLLFAAGACGEDPFTISGQLLDVTGEPESGQMVHVTYQPETLFAMEAQVEADTVTDEDGRFSFEIPPVNTFWNVELSIAGLPFATFNTEGASDGETLAVPSYREWDAQVLVAETNDGPRLTWDSIANQTVEATYAVNISTGNWTVLAEGNELLLDARLLQDAVDPSGDVLATAMFDDRFGLTWRSPFELPTGELVPLSKGASCFAMEYEGPESLLGGSGQCPITQWDGWGGAAYITVILDGLRNVNTVTVLGLESESVAVEILLSGDNLNYTSVGTLPLVSGQNTIIHELGSPVVAKWVRIMTDSEIASLAQIGVF